MVSVAKKKAIPKHKKHPIVQDEETAAPRLAEDSLAYQLDEPLPPLTILENYRHIEIPFEGISIGEASFLATLGRKYPSEDMRIEIGNGVINVYLRQIDFAAFQREIENTGAEFPLASEIVRRIAVLGSYGINGRKRLFVGYNNERKVSGRKKKVAKRESFFYAEGHNFSEKNNALPAEFSNKIFCADSGELLKKLPDNCVDLVFTSPPYNFGLEYDSDGDAADAHHWQTYFDKLFAIFHECIRVLKFGGRIIVNTQPLFSDYIPSHHIISNFFIQNKLILGGQFA